MHTLDQSFAALADPIRRAIINRLAQGEATVQDLARPSSISQPAINRYLKVLKQAGVLYRPVAPASCFATSTF